MSKKNLLAAAVLAFSSMSAMAGGLLTNTNQNAAYVRMMSQGAIIDITGLYANPAGTAFLSNGWHLSLNSQSAWQQRNIETTFPLFAKNTATPGNATHLFEGKAKAPVIPSFQLSYNKDKWSVNANFSLGGGGGKCTFGSGLGTFETLYSAALEGKAPGMMPTVMTGILMQEMGLDAVTANAIGATAQYKGYNLDSELSGRSYYFGLQLGATYKFMDNLAGFVGLRGVYATCNYTGHVNPTVAYSYTHPMAGVQNGDRAFTDANLSLDCDQSTFGITPIIGVDYKINEHWNVAAKYEAPTKMELKNSSTIEAGSMVAPMLVGNATIEKFADGNKVREDIPGMLTLGAQYSPIEKVRVNGTFNAYFDKSAKKYNDEQKLIDKNTWEISLGAEYDVCKLVTVSASWQNTNYGLSDAAMNDLSFNLSNNMVGLGLRVNAAKWCSIDLGYMHTFYQDRTVKSEVALAPTVSLPKTDNYVRKNDVFGIGVNLHF